MIEIFIDMPQNQMHLYVTNYQFSTLFFVIITFVLKINTASGYCLVLI